MSETPREVAEKQILADIALKRDQEDLADARELLKFQPFTRYFIRRLDEKKTALVKQIIAGNAPDGYLTAVALIKQIDEIKALPITEKSLIFKSLHGDAPVPVD